MSPGHGVGIGCRRSRSNSRRTNGTSPVVACTRALATLMAVAGTFRERRAIAGAQQRLGAVFDQRQFAFEHIDGVQYRLLGKRIQAGVA